MIHSHLFSISDKTSSFVTDGCSLRRAKQKLFNAIYLPLCKVTELIESLIYNMKLLKWLWTKNEKWWNIKMRLFQKSLRWIKANIWISSKSILKQEDEGTFHSIRKSIRQDRMFIILHSLRRISHTFNEATLLLFQIMPKS